MLRQLLFLLLAAVVRDKIVVKASLEGFEPTTRCLEGSRSVQLSYRDIFYYSNVARGEGKVKIVMSIWFITITMLALCSP